MERNIRKLQSLFLACALLFLNVGCSGDASSESGPFTPRNTIYDPPITESGDVLNYGGSGVSYIDTSNTSLGYFLVCYTGSSDKVQIQVTGPDGSVCPYPLELDGPQAFPLALGDGTYQVNVFEHLSESNYAVIQSYSFSVTLNDEFTPFLYPNQYIDYTKDSECVKLGISFSEKSSSNLKYINQVYDYVISTIVYDEEFAAHAPSNYIPDPDRTLSTKTGVCFDYASLMSAMLRSQGIPTRLQVGYSQDVYHAWISVYLEEAGGWVDKIIEFDGESWTLLDPTIASYTASRDVAEYISDPNNYYVQYNY